MVQQRHAIQIHDIHIDYPIRGEHCSGIFQAYRKKLQGGHVNLS
jgi:hypothetical protein